MDLFDDREQNCANDKRVSRWFLDAEFIEDGKTIDLISVGLVSECGNYSFYAVNTDCDYSKADDWVLENVLHPIGLSRRGFRIAPANASPNTLNTMLMGKCRTTIAKEIAFVLGCQQDFKAVRRGGFLGLLGLTKLTPVYGLRNPNKEIEVWADYCSYDWVVFCQLFGRMIDLPHGLPMYCNDLQQLWRSKGCPKLPSQQSGHHNALADAKHLREQWLFLQSL